MLSVALWRWYINTAIEIHNIILRPVFYLKHRMGNVHTSQETHNVSDKRLMISIEIWRRYINITVTILGIIRRPVSYLKHEMGNVRTSQETHYVSATSPAG
jgi:hypothetical protein